MGLLDRIKLRKPQGKRIIVFLGKKGARRLLGSLELSDKDDIALRVSEFLDKKVKELNIDPAEYPSVILMTEQGQQVKLENPFWEEAYPGSEEEKKPSKENSESLDFENAIKYALEMQGKIYSAMLDGITDGIKHVVSTSMSLGTELIKTQQEVMKQTLLRPQTSQEEQPMKLDLETILSMMLLSSMGLNPKGGMNVGQKQQS
jgi:hypothetical protein